MPNTPSLPEPDEALEQLAASRSPFLIGVRHHSPVCAAAIPKLLDGYRPEAVLIELPGEFAPWLKWLGHAQAQAPLALAGAARSGGLSFYPLADFSPELVALRWAFAHDVPVEAFDRSLGACSLEHDPWWLDSDLPAARSPSLLDRLLLIEQVGDFEELWDRRVEARGVGATPEAVRRAGLLLGWALRLSGALGEGISARDRAREGHMRARIAARSEERVAVVAGAFHAAALLASPLLAGGPIEEPQQKEPSDDEVDAPVTSLVAYAADLLDSRSGYPAGIRDPRWQQQVFEADAQPEGVEQALAANVVDVCSRLRARGHVAGVPDAREALRLALDLARLRGLSAPGRRELLESLETALARGERLGRGRVLAQACAPVLVGHARGRLAPGTPRSGLGPHTEELIAGLDLPGPDQARGVGPKALEPKDLRLDPLRSGLDRRRHVALLRLATLGVPYGERVDVEGRAGGAALTTRWRVRWTPETSALLELAGLRGVTLEQACEGELRATRQRAEQEGEGLSASARLATAAAACRCGLVGLAAAWLAELTSEEFLSEATLAQLLESTALVERVARGHLPGLQPPDAPGESGVGALPPFVLDEALSTAPLLAAAIAALEGVAGASDDESARALLALVRIVEREGLSLGRLGWTLDELARDAAPFMQGAASGARLLLERTSRERFAEQLASWTDASSQDLGLRLRGALIVSGECFEADPELTGPLRDRVEGFPDGAFLSRLPALRGGFSVLTPTARERLLQALAVEHPELDDPRALDTLELEPELLAEHVHADVLGRRAVQALGLDSLLPKSAGGSSELVPTLRPPPANGFAGTGPAPANPTPVVPRARRGHAPRDERAISTADRWRLILGRARRCLKGKSARAARALDELYGCDAGQEGGGDGSGGGQEAGFPTTREWAQELEQLFGAAVREEVLGKAAEGGDVGAALELDPESVRPSVELLQQVLALKGSLAPGQLAQLRPLIRRVVDQLVEELAVRLAPATSGLATRRPTRRPGGPLDLQRTVRKNLHTVWTRDDGTPALAPERWVFRQRARKTLDWRLILVVDVSGSMEPSVIYSALMAAILTRLPALSVEFLAFNTEVIDLSERVDDPLSLLLEVEVGGGTHLARALRVARERIRVPQRTLVVTVSDFEEGFPLGGLLAEVRALITSGVTSLGLAALDDRGQPRYSRAIAERVVAAGMPVAALTPLELARWVGEQIR